MDPLPCLAVVRYARISLHERQRLVNVSPAPECFASEHELGVHTQHPKQIPKLAHVRLDRSCSAQQQVPCARPDLEHEVEKIGGLIISIPQAPSSPCLVCLVQDHGAVLPLEQVLAFLRVVEYESGGHDGDLRWAACDVLGTPHPDLVPMVIEPELLRRRPDSAGNAQLVGQLHLPLQGQRRRAENQHRPIFEQTRDQGACCERKRLADPDLIGQEQPCFAVGLPVLEERRDERSLPGLELFTSPVDRRLCERCGRQLRWCDVIETDLDALRDALDLLDDGIRQRVGVRPQRREFFLHPCDALW